MDVSGDYAVVADERSGVEIVDVSDPTAPVIVGSTATRANSVSNAADVVVRDRLAYVADGATTLGGVKVIDFSFPDNPVVIERQRRASASTA